jgi:curved DNA-binding protein
MVLDYKNFYQALELPRQATELEIRRAFRVLARRYHPDVAGDSSEAEARFKEVSEAYEVLRDPDKRRKYDQFLEYCLRGEEVRWARRSRQGAGFEFRYGGGFRDWFDEFSPGPGPSHGTCSGEDVEAEIVVSTIEVIQGSVRPITLQRLRRCEGCGGSGRASGRLCDKCSGAGHISYLETYQVRIPPGVTEGQRLRIPGQGEPPLGAGRPGDLYLRICYAQNPNVRIEGQDVASDLNVAPWEAVLGANISVTVFDEEMQVRIPPGSQTGQRLRLRGHGLRNKNGGKGDYYFVLRVQVPLFTSPRERSLWEQLAAESTFQPREE